MWEIHTKSSVLDEHQGAVFVIMGEIRPVVEPDHDPVGGGSSGLSLLHLKNQNIPLSLPAPVGAVFRLQRCPVFQRPSYICSAGRVIGENRALSQTLTSLRSPPSRFTM